MNYIIKFLSLNLLIFAVKMTASPRKSISSVTRGRKKEIKDEEVWISGNKMDFDEPFKTSGSNRSVIIRLRNFFTLIIKNNHKIKIIFKYLQENNFFMSVVKFICFFYILL